MDNTEAISSADAVEGSSETRGNKVLVEDVPEDPEEHGITMLDVLKDEQTMEQDAKAVLGAADDQNCTYSSGYMTRQALYSCETCSVPGRPDFTPAGVCLACSYHCHEGHNLVELYTKRLFRCDCGTSRLTSCKLLKSGSKEDNVNKYNQNFSGVYCVCARPYPDPEDAEPDEMIQCIVCEDWYHGRHLSLSSGPPVDSEYGEMICVGCTTKHPLLVKYRHLAVNESAGEKDNDSVKDKGEEKEEESGENTAKCSVASKTGEKPGSLFLPEGWRSQLCKCDSCSLKYKEEELEFLLDPNDTVHSYEEQAQEDKGQFEKGMEALSQLDRVKQVEAIHSYNSMKEDLMEYLGKFAANGKVVREEDIKEFFEGMKSRKKPRLGSGPPSTCK